MKSHTDMKTKQTSLQFHHQLVEEIVHQVKPSGLLLRPLTQWFLWLASSLLVVSFFWMHMGVQSNLSQVMGQMPPLLFVVTAFAGASLAAWEAISSSVPGRETGRLYRALAVLFLIALVCIPFIFFAHTGSLQWGRALSDDTGCVEGVSFSGLIPWIFMGWMLSRNASFYPWRTGLWSGVSAFLMGTITIQIHCPNWEVNHVLMAHLLPAAVGTIVVSLLGSFWFSRWKK
jgi:hypothetical protein